MANENFLAEVLIGQIPTLLLYVGALVYALFQLSKVRLPAQLAAAGCGVILCERLAWAFLYDSMMRKFVAGEILHADFAAKLERLGYLFTLAYVCGFALVVVAVFVGRAPKPAPSFLPYGPFPPA
jgi:hypothetical protein